MHSSIPVNLTRANLHGGRVVGWEGGGKVSLSLSEPLMILKSLKFGNTHEFGNLGKEQFW